ncbi:MAG: HEAT repeat domain-containing protein [Woeseiaceae bacterium]|nr:HEAT repeat domain-containing protein [Woeseiaceae bacterium]
MLDWLLRSNFDPLATIAVWSIAAVLVATIVLFAYTLGLRFATITSHRRRTSLVLRWRDVFASAVLSARNAAKVALPRLKKAHRTDVLEEWNRIRDSVQGEAADNLIVLGKRMGLIDVARRRLARRALKSQVLAVQTLGHLRDRDSYDTIAALLPHPNLALSITAAVALVDIDPDRAVGVLVPMIEERRDWPRNRVSIFLRMAGSDRISEPMYRAIRAADDEARVYLLQFARLIEPEVLDALLNELIRTSNDAGVLSASLKMVSGLSTVPRIAALTRHKTWFVRMHAAQVLGQLGQREHLSLLEAMLDDPEWWVRYRAAQAITTLPFMGPNHLRQMYERQTDRYAADMLKQAIAEVGLA